MATTFVIACPECEKQIKVSDAVVGKKIRCKECAHVFAVKAPKSAPAKAEAKATPKDEGKPEKKTNAELEEEDDDGKNPYALAKDDDNVPRCPNCVKALESAEDRICLHCGYDLVKRVRAETRTVYESTGEEKFKWLLPGILPTGIVLLIVVSILIMFKTRSIIQDSFLYDDDNKRFIIKPGCFMLFNGGVTAFICYQLGRFAYRRLVLDNKPPEREVRKDDEDDEEDEDDD